MGMTRKYHNHTLQPNPWHHNKEPQNTNSQIDMSLRPDQMSFNLRGNKHTMDINTLIGFITRHADCHMISMLYPTVCCSIQRMLYKVYDTDNLVLIFSSQIWFLLLKSLSLTLEHTLAKRISCNIYTSW